MHENYNGPLRFSLEDIQFDTENFDDKHCVGKGGVGKIYEGKLPKGYHTIVAKLFDVKGGQGDKQFQNELQILSKYKHNNIISLVGYCAEKDAKIIVYEYASRGSLDRYLDDARLDWKTRLTICIDAAIALVFLHRAFRNDAITLIHRDIKTASILLNDKWKAKLANFGLSLIKDRDTDYAIDNVCCTKGYVDPVYLKSGFLTKESDINSFGILLFEVLCGRSEYLIHKQEGVSLPSFVKHSFDNGKLDEVVFEKIKNQTWSSVLTDFYTIA
ncbi:probable receptor-like protein kinase At2g23200 [Rutidosis leptorrhynchoides]|uniref:probable receptor-like protein kinase At2g23200 n=1 Tax=Rutidosis leptorrhynchoides TaxID=125765 RepID=UPI003A9A4BFF